MAPGTGVPTTAAVASPVVGEDQKSHALGTRQSPSDFLIRVKRIRGGAKVGSMGTGGGAATSRGAATPPGRITARPKPE